MIKLMTPQKHPDKELDDSQNFPMMNALAKSMSFRISDQLSNEASDKLAKSSKTTNSKKTAKRSELLQPVHKNFYSSGIFGRRSGVKVDAGIMVDFYTNAINQPHKLEHNLAKIEAMLIKYESNHQDLVKALCEKYNTEAFFMQLAKSELQQESHSEAETKIPHHQHDGQWWDRTNNDCHGQFMSEPHMHHDGVGGLSSQISAI